MIAPRAGRLRVSHQIFRRLPAVLAGALALGGCSLFVPPPRVRGNQVGPNELHHLAPGTTTEAQARALLGSPTAHGTFDPNHWYYITETTRPVIGGTQHVATQGVVVLSFDRQGVLRTVDRIGPKAALPAPIVARTTPSPGGQAGFLQQLIGNIGGVNPLGTASESPGGGAPIP